MSSTKTNRLESCGYPKCTCSEFECKFETQQQPEATKIQRDGDQELPKPNNKPAIQDLVLQDMLARKMIGQQRYGTPLQPHNGRDMMQDLYEELLDACNYIRGMIYERDGK
jgi:hypothetical protein